jgi:hypothetical protein
MWRISWVWYFVPSVAVVLVGLATCSLIDVADFDTFVIEGSLPHPSGIRSAVVVRQWHADSAATVKCVWQLTGSAPRPGPSPRLADRCVLVATDPEFPVRLVWQRNGRLAAEFPAVPTTAIADHRSMACYFEREKLGSHVCYSPSDIDVMPRP